MYSHLVQYYETDKMGVTHHSNYIRFMEEARLDFFKNLGYDYLEFEKMGVFSPVVGLNNIRYKKPSTVNDVIDIEVNIKSMNSVTFIVSYVMKIKDTVIFTGESEHCLISKEGKILPLNNKITASFYELIKGLIKE
jgi:acyl-CoA thioester hydrolase